MRRMAEFIVRVVFKSYSGAWRPFGVFFGDSLEWPMGGVGLTTSIDHSLPFWRDSEV